MDRSALPPRSTGRNFTLLWSGYTVNVFGTAVTTVAVPLVALITLDASTFEVGLVAAAGVAAWLLFGLSAGVWVDRMPRRRLLVSCDAVRAVAVVSIPVAAFTGVLTLWHLLVVAFVVGVASVFYEVALQTYIPEVVEPRRLITANSRLQASESVSQVGGPPLGGAIVQVVGAPATLLLDFVSYVVSGATLATIRQPAPSQRSAGKSRMLAEIREGLAFVVRERTLRALTASAAILNVFGVALDTLAIIFLVRTLALPVSMVGVLLAAGGLGGVLGALLASTLSGTLGSARALRLAVIGGPLLVLCVPLADAGPRLVLFAVGLGGINAFTVVFAVIARTYRQLASPPELLGRVTATMRFVSWGVLPFGALLAGSLGQALGNRTALWMVCAAFCLLPLPVLASPLRTARDLPGQPGASTGDAGGTEPATTTSTPQR